MRGLGTFAELASAIRKDQRSSVAIQSVAQMRAWQQRFGWPRCAKVGENGWQYFDVPLMVEEFRHIRARLQSGKTWREVVDDSGFPITKQRETQPFVVELSMPQTTYGRHFRIALERGLRSGNVALVRMLSHAVVRVAPRDRAVAAWEVAKTWLRWCAAERIQAPPALLEAAREVRDCEKAINQEIAASARIRRERDEQEAA